MAGAIYWKKKRGVAPQGDGLAADEAAHEVVADEAIPGGELEPVDFYHDDIPLSPPPCYDNTVRPFVLLFCIQITFHEFFFQVDQDLNSLQDAINIGLASLHV